VAASIEQKKMLSLARKAIEQYFSKSDENLLAESTSAM